MSVLPSTEVIYHIKATRAAVRQVALQLGYHPEVRPFTWYQDRFHTGLEGLVHARYSFQLIEDLEYETWLRE